jgi:hypothetical protein
MKTKINIYTITHNTRQVCDTKTATFFYCENLCKILIFSLRLGFLSLFRYFISLQLTGLGGMILIAGFLAFNGGTLGTMTNPGDSEVIAHVISNTIMGGSGGSITVMLVSKLGLNGTPRWSFTSTLNGAFIGMVSSICQNSVQTFAH